MRSHHSFEEKRAAPRKRVMMAGTIEFVGGRINCLVRDISISGAVLYVTSSLEIPDRFNLIFQENAGRVPCRVARRKEKQIGVTFD